MQDVHQQCQRCPFTSNKYIIMIWEWHHCQKHPCMYHVNKKTHQHHPYVKSSPSEHIFWKLGEVLRSTWESRRTRRVGSFYQGPWVTESGSEKSAKFVGFWTDFLSECPDIHGKCEWLQLFICGKTGMSGWSHSTKPTSLSNCGNSQLDYSIL